ncbi:PIN domain-containing protein [Brevibacterium yomogidense]|uniref:PIN domain-containing protein n=1 Tax=Brevibacterium yomogidense TaxID=946573 RepID=UPI0018E025B6|nr:PIN domain-containing protein [Brevibacterium yomogidense]
MTDPTAAPEPACAGSASTGQAPTGSGPTAPDALRLRRVLVDASVLAPEPLWLWMLALTEGVAAEHRPQLFVTQAIGWELRPALRRIDPRLTRAQATLAARLRMDSLTRPQSSPSDPAAEAALTEPPPATPLTEPPATTAAEAPPTAPPTGPRPHVLDPDDAHLDEAALALDVDVLVTDDIHAFAPIRTAARGYALLSADEFLCTLTDTFDLSVPEAADRYRSHLTRVARQVGLEPQPGSPSHRLRRSRARRFAKRVVRSTR